MISFIFLRTFKKLLNRREKKQRFSIRQNIRLCNGVCNNNNSGIILMSMVRVNFRQNIPHFHYINFAKYTVNISNVYL